MKRVIKVQKRKSNTFINLPKAMLEETGLTEEVELVIENKGKTLIITKKEK